MTAASKFDTTTRYRVTYESKPGRTAEIVVPGRGLEKALAWWAAHNVPVYGIARRTATGWGQA